MKNTLIIFWAMMCLCACNKTDSSVPTNKQQNHTTINFDNSKIQYEGRVEIKPNDAAYLYWTGTAVRLRFNGTGISVSMQDFSTGNDNYFYVIVDKQIKGKIKIEKDLRSYTLIQNLPEDNHEVELFKITHMHPGYKRSYSKLYDFELLGKGEILDPPAPKKRKIEFYGNSITCGLANEDDSGADRNASIYENNYLTYGAITARHFDAQYYCIARSGIGLMASTSNLTMPQMYNLLNPFDTKSKWDFTKYTPDIVVVNLLQNDASLLVNPVTGEVVENYQDFIRKIRTVYPQAHIICALGNMGAVNIPKWPQIIKDAVEGLNDNKVYTHFFTYRGKSGHPSVAEHEDMANSLINFIESNIEW
ncbi:SGNH/GDSL hydrolase family protein [Pseudopedobacter beijingensis]|uniref:Electron transporter RnfD n=1 Tax=Pseudopedobacter beijingensis TaxID=1207056 RepID=A0ABW4ICL7_9SPHI